MDKVITGALYGFGAGLGILASGVAFSVISGLIVLITLGIVGMSATIAHEAMGDPPAAVEQHHAQPEPIQR